MDQRGLPLLGSSRYGDHPADNVSLVRAPLAQVPPRQPCLQPGPGQPSSCQRDPPSRLRHFCVHGCHSGVGGGRVHPSPRQLPRPLFQRRVRRGPVRGRLLRAAFLRKVAANFHVAHQERAWGAGERGDQQCLLRGKPC